MHAASIFDARGQLNQGKIKGVLALVDQPGQALCGGHLSGAVVGSYRDCVDLNGMGEPCAGIHALDLSCAEVTGDQIGGSDVLVELAGKVVRRWQYARRSLGLPKLETIGKHVASHRQRSRGESADMWVFGAEAGP